MSRELDIELVELLGYKVTWIDQYISEFMESTKYKKPVINYIDKYDYDPIPYYHKDGNDMLELDIIMREKGFYLRYENDKDNEHIAIYKRRNEVHINDKPSVGRTMPEAVAKAAREVLRKQ